MARLQILELPEGVNDERAPFVLVIDQCEGMPLEVVKTVESMWHRVGEQIGARGVLIFMETVEIPANEVPIGPDRYPVRLRVEADTTQFEEAMERVQRSIGLDADRAARAEAKLNASRVNRLWEERNRMDQITDALGFDRLRDWDQIVEAIKTQREGGHRFDVPGYRDPHRCAQCGLDRQAWIFGRDRRTCDEAQTKEAG